MDAIALVNYFLHAKLISFIVDDDDVNNNSTAFIHLLEMSDNELGIKTSHLANVSRRTTCLLVRGN